MLEKLKFIFEELWALVLLIFDFLIMDPLLLLMLLWPILLISGTVFFFFNFTATSIILLSLGAVGALYFLWEIFF